MFSFCGRIIKRILCIRKLNKYSNFPLQFRAPSFTFLIKSLNKAFSSKKCSIKAPMYKTFEFHLQWKKWVVSFHWIWKKSWIYFVNNRWAKLIFCCSHRVFRLQLYLKMSISLSFFLFRVVPKICIKSLKTRASGNFPLRNTHNICQQLATRCIVNDDDCKQKQHTQWSK